jgi:hypothetical protein
VNGGGFLAEPIWPERLSDAPPGIALARVLDPCVGRLIHEITRDWLRILARRGTSTGYHNRSTTPPQQSPARDKIFFPFHVNTRGNAPAYPPPPLPARYHALYRSLPPSTALLSPGYVTRSSLSPRMFTYLPAHRVLIYVEHQHAVYGLDEHLKRHHGLPAAKRRELLAAYTGLAIDAPEHVSLPAPGSAPIAGLGQAQSAFLCCQEEAREAGDAGDAGEAGEVQQRLSCSYITINQQEMRKHTNQQHRVKLTRWSSPAAASYKEHVARLWERGKVQSFFRERRYARCFVVQEEEAQQEQQQQDEQQQGWQQHGNNQEGNDQQGNEQQESERQADYKQRLALLTSSLEALKREDSKAIDRIAEEASTKDRTGWFKRTRWDEHLQA